MKQLLARYSILILAAGSIAMAGCNTEATEFDVTISWNIAGAPTCQAFLDGDTTLTFDEVVVTVYDEEENVVDTSPKVPCTDFEYQIPDLEEGTYSVTVFAYADHDGDYLPYYQARGKIEAPEPSDEEYKFGLEVGTSTITIIWGFEFGTCGVNNVQTISVEMQGDKYTIPAEETTCDSAEGMVIDSIWWDTYDIIVKGFSGTDQTHQGMLEDLVLKPNTYDDPYQVRLNPLD